LNVVHAQMKIEEVENGNKLEITTVGQKEELERFVQVCTYVCSYVCSYMCSYMCCVVMVARRRSSPTLCQVCT